MREDKQDVGAPEAPALLRAVRATVDAIDTRARIHRWTVLAAGSAVLVPLLVAPIVLSWRPLPFVAVVVPVVAAFLVLDSWTVLRWQRRILDLWLSGDLRLSDLRHTLGTMRHLPSRTLDGMLERLPRADAPQRLDALPASAKGSIVAASLERVHRQDRRSALSTAGATLLACSVAAGVSVQTPVALPVAMVGVLILAASRWAGGRRTR